MALKFLHYFNFQLIKKIDYQILPNRFVLKLK